MAGSPRRVGRPTEQDAYVTDTVHVRLTEDEARRLRSLAAGEGTTVSRLLRRAVREMVNRGPDLFDDGLQEISEIARQLAATGRNLNQIAAALNAGSTSSAAIRAELACMQDDVERAQTWFRGLITASRQRWVVSDAGMKKGRR